MGAIGTAADIGIRVFLDDAASGGLLRIDQAMKDIGDDADKGSGKVSNMVGKMAAMGALVGAVASLALFTAAIKYSVDAASEFQQAMFSVAVATHVPMQAAMQYTNQLMNLAAGSIYSSTQIADGIVLLGRSGYGIHDIFTYMAQAGIALGIATRTSATDGFKLLAQTMTAFQAPASQAMHYADLLQFAFEHQTGSVSQLSSAFANASPAAARLGIPLRELVAALDVVGPALGNTSTAGTALRYMMQAVTSPTAQAISALASLGIITVSSTTPALQRFTDSLLRTGTVSSSFIRTNDTSVAGLKNLFAAAQAAGLVPLDAKFNEWAASSGVMQNAFFDAHGKAKDLTNIIQVLTQHMKGMNDEAKAAYLKDIFSVRGGQAAQVLLQQIQKYQEYLKQLATSQDNAGGAMRRWQEVMATFQGAMAGLGSSIRDLGVVIGLQILPYLTAAATAFNRFVSFVRTAANGSSEATGLFLKFGVALSVIAVIGAIVAMVMLGIGIPFLIFAGIAIAVVVAVVGLSIGLTMLVMWVRQTANAASPLGAVFRALGGVFSDVGTFVRTQFAQAWHTVQQAMAPLGPAFSQLGSAIRPLMPIIGFLAAIIGAVLVGALHGVIQAISVFIGGLAMILAGVIRVITGIVMVVAGVLTILYALVTHNDALLQQGFTSVWNGIKQIIGGVLQAILGVFVAVFGTIIGFVAGFVHGVVSFFTWLAGILVGHSIVPDMMNAIRNVIMSVLNAVASFVQGILARIGSIFSAAGSTIHAAWTAAMMALQILAMSALNAIVTIISGGMFRSVGQVINAGVQIVGAARNAWNGFVSAVRNGINNAVSIISSLRGIIGGILGSIVGAAFSGGANIVHAIANGIQSAIGAVVGAVQNVVGFISAHLPHSPAKMGPLRELPYQASMIARQIAEGIQSGTPSIQGALNVALGGITSSPVMSRAGTPMTSGGGGGGRAGTQTINLVLDGRVVTQVVLNNLNGQMQMNGLGRAFR